MDDRKILADAAGISDGETPRPHQRVLDRLDLFEARLLEAFAEFTTQVRKP